MRDLAGGGVGQVLLVAGDAGRPGHPFSHSLQILETRALRDKQALAARDGLSMHIVTQFRFHPHAIHTWARQVAAEIALPVRVGVTGPAPTLQLIRCAMACGVGASLRGLVHNANAFRKVSGRAAHPDERLIGLVCEAGDAPSPLHGIHLFALGGVVKSARWLHAVTDSRFRLTSAHDRFETFPACSH